MAGRSVKERPVGVLVPARHLGQQGAELVGGLARASGGQRGGARDLADVAARSSALAGPAPTLTFRHTHSLDS